MDALAEQQQRHKHLLGHTIADGRLELVSILGLGAYGVVYLARDLTHPLHRQPFASSSSSDLPRILASRHGGAASGYYAVKCLNKLNLDARQKRFQRREIVLHTMVSNHPSVVTLYRVIDEKEDPCIYVILDYCPDGDLFSMITENQRYTVPMPTAEDGCADAIDVDSDPVYQQARFDMDGTVRKVFTQLLDSVAFCHDNGIYHRDLKPENILCLQGGEKIVLADFGLATSEKTSNDFGCGSTFYMGPECQGGIGTQLDQYTTVANDVWSLGVILVNLICGRNPWKQASVDDETFREYLRNPDFLMEILPISRQTNELLKRVFTIREDWRCSLADLRAMVHQVSRFTATQSEIQERHRIARHAAQRARQEAARAKAAEDARFEAEKRHGVHQMLQKNAFFCSASLETAVDVAQPQLQQQSVKQYVQQQQPGPPSSAGESTKASSLQFVMPQTPTKAQQCSAATSPSSVKGSVTSCPTAEDLTESSSFPASSSFLSTDDAMLGGSSAPSSPVESETEMMPDDDSESQSDGAESRRSSYYVGMPATPVFEPLQQQRHREQAHQQEQAAAYDTLQRAMGGCAAQIPATQVSVDIQHAAAAATLNCSLQNMAIQSMLTHATSNEEAVADAHPASHFGKHARSQGHDITEQHPFLDGGASNFFEAQTIFQPVQHKDQRPFDGATLTPQLASDNEKAVNPGSAASRFRTLPSRNALRPPAIAANARRLRNNIFGS